MLFKEMKFSPFQRGCCVLVTSFILTIFIPMKVKVKSFSRVRPTLCDPTDCSPPGSSVHGISQERILEWVAISFSRGSSWARDRTQVSRTVDRLFTVWATREPYVLSLNQKNVLFPNEGIGGMNRGEGSESRNWVLCVCWLKTRSLSSFPNKL